MLFPHPRRCEKDALFHHDKVPCILSRAPTCSTICVGWGYFFALRFYDRVVWLSNTLFCISSISVMSFFELSFWGIDFMLRLCLGQFARVTGRLASSQLGMVKSNWILHFQNPQVVWLQCFLELCMCVQHGVSKEVGKSDLAYTFMASLEFLDIDGRTFFVFVRYLQNVWSVVSASSFP